MKQRFLRSKYLLPATLAVTIFAFGLVFFTGRSANAAYQQPAAPLSLAKRVDCQTAVAAIYWQESDWPAANPDAKPALSAILPRAAVENQAADTLAQTVALQAQWDLAVTPDMLQAELERMVGYSQDPARLARLFAALNNDPTLIVECLVRPVLVDRLIRQQYGADPALHTTTRHAAESALSGITTAAQLVALPDAETVVWTPENDAESLPADFAAGEPPLAAAAFANRQAEIKQAFNLRPDDALPLDQVSPLQENDGRFYSLAVLAATDERLEAVYAAWPKQTFETWWAENQADFSAADFSQPDYEYALPAFPAAPEGGGGDAWHYLPAMPWSTASSESVWTGSVMLVWGGGNTNGFRYDPVLDDWRPITTLNAPGARTQFTAVWSGTEMIVFGGCNGFSEFCTDGSGGRYNPVTDTWSPMAMYVARRQHAAVWSGTEMLVWGGCTENANGNQNCNTSVTQGARYNPATDSWSPMTTAGAPSGGANQNAVWAGDQMIVWNGSGGAKGRYFPATNSWQPISVANAPAAAVASLIWTGSEMIAWGGCSGANGCPTPHNTGGRYNPQTDTWTATSLTGAPAARSVHTAVWTGSEMLVWGGSAGAASFLSDGGRYNPATDSWTPINNAGSPSPRHSQHAHWTGQVMVVWGGTGQGDERTGGRYNPATDSWLPTTTNDPYRLAISHVSIWDGTHMISWGGQGEQVIDPYYQRARLYDPATDVWSMSSQNPDLPYFWWPTAVWTGSEMIIWGGQFGANAYDAGARYNPLTDSWSPTSMVDVPEARAGHTAIWTGSDMIIWGGSTWTTPYEQTGGRYNPQSNSWTPMTVSGAPAGRDLHQAIWTGSEMLVWGGRGETGFLSDGGRYDPAANSWAPMSTVDAPTGRVLFAAVWTGTEFLIWGGGNYNFGWSYYQSGGRYDPQTDTWTPTSLVDAPEGRARFASVWTGQEMVAWGGCNYVNCLTGVSTGGRYNPTTDSWTATTENHVIEAREFHTMVWTGSSVLVWGGQADRNGYTHTGGRYDLSTPANLPPLATADIYTTTANVPLLVAAPGVLANDEDPDGGLIQAVLLTLPASGQLSLAGDGSINYAPAADFTGQVSFTYRAFDGTAYSEPAAVTIVVAPPVVYQIFIPIVGKQ